MSGKRKAPLVPAAVVDAPSSDVTPKELESALFPLETIMALAPDAIGPDGRLHPLRSAGDTTHLSTPAAFFGDDEDEPFDRAGPLAVVSVIGPLMQYGGWFFDGYEAIRQRFAAALMDPASGAVALIINSPGGVCTGCFETVAAMQKMKAAAGKPVFAFADESAYSAGYAIACVADEIYLPEPGGVGSVGVIGVLADRTKANEAQGLNVVVVASGNQKGDGHPDQELSKEAIDRYRERTTQLAGIFASLVASARNKSTADVIGLQAACLYGRNAVNAGLANGVKSRDQFLAYAQRQAKSALTKSAKERASMGTKENAAERGESIAGESILAPIVSSSSSFALAAGIRHDADEGAILGRIAELRGIEAKVQALTSTRNLDEALGAIQAGQIAIGQLANVQTELSALRESSKTSEVESLIERGKAEGKITTVDMEQALRATGAESPARLRTLLNALPVAVGAATPTPEPKGTGLTGDELLVAKQLNLTPEQLAAGKAALAGVATTTETNK